MSNKMVCRVCAVDSVRMYTIVDTELQRVYEKLTNISLHADSRPLTVCYICHSQLRTTQQLMLKALKVEDILNPILNGEVQMSTVDRQAHKLTNSLLVSRTEHMSIELPLCNKVVKVEPPEECVGGEDQQEHLWTEIFIKEEPVFDNPGNELYFECDATQSNHTGVSEQRQTRDQERCAEKDTGISIIKKEPVCDHHNSLLKAVPADDAPHSYDVKFVVRRETTNVATYGRKRKELKHKLRQPENAIKIKPPEMLQQTENAGTSAHNEETYINVSKTKIVTKTSSELDLKRDTYICNDCNRVFNSKSILCKHIQRHLLLKASNKTKNKLAGNLKSSKQHECYICDYTSKHAAHLKVHIRTHTGEKPFACHVCNFKCNMKSSLKIHLRTHTGEKPYACHICDYKGSQLGHIIVHLRKHTGERPYPCHLCDFKCKTTGILQKHLRTHTDTKMYSCHLCDFKCKYNNSLQVHLRKHTGEKPYACHLCDLKCTTSGNLQIHLRKHTGEKPYACYICDYKASQHNNLRAHLRRHAGDEQYACRICDYKSTQMSCLRAHIGTHMDENQYACHLCDHEYNQLDSLRNHLRTRHTDEKSHLAIIKKNEPALL